MKILHILDHSLPVHDGYSFRSQNIFQAQRNRGWQPVIVTSPKHEGSWKGISSQKITPVFNGINPDDFRPCEPDAEYQKAWNLKEKTVIGFIGSFYRYEGLDLLINAFSHLTSKPTSLPVYPVAPADGTGASKLPSIVCC